MKAQTSRPKGLQALQERIGYSFKDEALLAKAVVHASAREQRRGDDNERLEFLGDRVLGLTIAELLYGHFPDASEGELARRFNRLVRRETCAEVAREMLLGQHLVLSPSEQIAGGCDNVNILGDACEALLGAIFLDGGFRKARKLILGYWKPRLQQDEGPVTADPKTALQEWAQGHRLKLPRYVEVSRSGPDHDPLFVMEVLIERLEPQRGEGSSKRMAERNAAAAMLVREGVWKEANIHD